MATSSRIRLSDLDNLSVEKEKGKDSYRDGIWLLFLLLGTLIGLYRNQLTRQNRTVLSVEPEAIICLSEENAILFTQFV